MFKKLKIKACKSLITRWSGPAFGLVPDSTREGIQGRDLDKHEPRSMIEKECEELVRE